MTIATLLFRNFAAMKIQKTNVARLLEKAKIQFELIPYEVDENDLSAGHIASQLNEDLRQVFKTLVLFGEKSKHFVGVVPGDSEVDLKKAAKVSGNKKVDLIAMKDLLPTTGYIRGGCSPIGMKKHFPTYVHASAQTYEYIYVSARVRGLQIKLSPQELINAANAQYADLTNNAD